ncbi:hypothetical protein ACRE_051340 [Hapsidospora chrysogenum ATCC 11550]|uniref:AB hydrolase-1 domain-containing protein n=1 Tax=Hapsidospora chrysogenum (strain ATCC 11550 / CBS 779.69 / DSM 880 / IAM 14645 / JCM 23072 / IMI 49137) TaxID=857340 RepID=A0A086T411_HAPC1|nr:hypothetical protein ACRE_051340 [Hapsidospora chrysogenum ATCC 11550]
MYVTVEGQPLYFRVYYPELPVRSNGVTFVFIHGLGSSHSFYAAIIPSLVRQGYTCLAIDTPGSALSPLGDHDRSPSEIARLILGSFSSMAIDEENIIAVGHSMGAMVACELGSLTRLRGIVLIGPVHPTPALANVFAERIKNVEEIQLSFFLELTSTWYTDGLEILADTIPTAATGSKSTPVHHAFIHALILSSTPKGYISLCCTIANASPPNYGQLRCPLVIIAGSDDKTSAMAGCQHIVDRASPVNILSSWGNNEFDPYIETLDGVGHWHCIEAPEEVLNVIEKFCARLGPR